MLIRRGQRHDGHRESGTWDSNAWSPPTLSAWVVTPLGGGTQPFWCAGLPVASTIGSWVKAVSAAHRPSEPSCASSCTFSRGDFLFLAVQLRLWNGWRQGKETGFQGSSKSGINLVGLTPPLVSCIKLYIRQTNIDHSTPIHLYISFSYIPIKNVSVILSWTLGPSIL